MTNIKESDANIKETDANINEHDTNIKDPMEIKPKTQCACANPPVVFGIKLE